MNNPMQLKREYIYAVMGHSSPTIKKGVNYEYQQLTFRRKNLPL
jgi:hypothetical protein